MTIKTNEDGDAILLFIGVRDKGGIIKGSRYVRILKYDKNQNKIKDHWEMKGKAS